MIYRNTIEPLAQPSAIALGLFDGVHLGHQQVIGQAVDAAKNGLLATVLSFHTEHAAPMSKRHNATILTESVKRQLLEALGVQAFLQPDFEQIRGISASRFVEEVLVGTLRAKVIVCGFNYHFGKGARGNAAMLRQIAEPLGVQVVVVPPRMDHGRPISSTRIREALLAGDILTANRLLGYAYCIDFEVVSGAQLGRTIGFPTINQQFPSHFLIPRFGVYASYVDLDCKRYLGVTNIGIKPTVVNRNGPLAETHIIDYHGDLYGKNVRVHLMEFLRPERKFLNIDDLTQAIKWNKRQVVEKYRSLTLDNPSIL